jgi:hypothetical protein
MEKAVIKTLIYADCFDFPLKAWEVHKWLMGKKVDLRQIERCLNRLIKKGEVGFKQDYYFLKGRKKLVNKRVSNLGFVRNQSRRAYFYGGLLRVIPWIKMVGISGSLAVENSDERSDIDLFIITDKERLWISRLFSLIIMSFFGVRREKYEKEEQAVNKICINSLIDINNLAFYNNNIYLAHELLQLRVIWQRDNVYQHFLESNLWALKLLPNWSSGVEITKLKKTKADGQGVFRILESCLRFLQIRYMGPILGKEKIGRGFAFFYPNDYQDLVLKKYRKNSDRLNLLNR